MVGYDHYGVNIQRVIANPDEYFEELEFVKNFKVPEYDDGTRGWLENIRNPLPPKRSVVGSILLTHDLKFFYFSEETVSWRERFKLIGFIKIFTPK